MRIPYSCLKDSFPNALPEPKELARLLTMRSFEIESVTQEGDDWIIEADVLPNRQHDCLGLRYVIQEISAILGVPRAPHDFPALPTGDAPSVSVSVEDARCRRYILVEVSGVSAGASPEWLAEKCAEMGQRSINQIVDASNFVLFVENQPTHAFDADKVRGAIRVRAAAAGEKITTLDGRDLSLDEGTLVIADDEGPLAIAGVKGGNRAGVTASTTRVYLESANFDGPTVRRAGQRYDLRTDSSKRFEAEIAPELAERGMARLVEAVRELCPNAQVSGALDHWPRRAHPYRTGVSASEASRLIGREVTLAEAKAALERVGCQVEELSDVGGRIVEVAVAAVGKPYRYGASVLFDAPNAFDCSSLVAYACAQAGLSAPRIAVDQFAWGREISEAELQPGDLVFSCVGGATRRAPQKATMDYARGTAVATPGDAGVDQAGIYIGDGEVIHATSSGGDIVKREKLSGSAQFGTIVGYRRATLVDEPRLVATVPAERLDLRAPEDLIEEIGRLGNLEELQAVALPEVPAKTATGEFALARAIRAALIGRGFYEVMTSSFVPGGDLEVLKPANAERPSLRVSLEKTFVPALMAGAAHRHWLARPNVFAFEVGRVFLSGGREELRLILGVAGAKVADPAKYAALLKTEILKTGVPAPEVLSGKNVPNLHLENSVAGPVTAVWAEVSIAGLELEPASALAPLAADHRYQPLSTFPYSARDVAVWVPGEGGEEAKVADVIRAAAGPLLAKLYKFDEFTKPAKDDVPTRTSYGFRLILQAMDHTLSDAEIAGSTDAVYAALRAQGWEIR